MDRRCAVLLSLPSAVSDLWAPLYIDAYSGTAGKLSQSKSFENEWGGGERKEEGGRETESKKKKEDEKLEM